MPTRKPPQLLEFDSPWLFQPGVVRVIRPTADVSCDDLRERVYRNEMTQPYIVETSSERRLHFTRDATQSVMLLDDTDALIAPYKRKMMSFLLFNPNPRHIVMIGLGGGSLPKFCYRQLRETRITVVEINADVIALRDEFCVPRDDERFRVVHDDGARYVEELNDSVDVMLVDAFDARGIAPSLAASDFYARAAEQLTSDGVLVMNLFGQGARYVDNLKRVRAVFGKRLRLVPVEGGENVLLFAFKHTVPWPVVDELESRARYLQSRLNLEFPRYLRRICEGQSLVVR